MGEGKRRELFRQDSRADLLQRHPQCCYCGEPAVTTDHFPNRAIFKSEQGRLWPEGYEFPCCDPCNNASREFETVATVLLRPTLFAKADAAWKASYESLEKNKPELVAEWKTPIQPDEADKAVAMRRAVFGSRMVLEELGIFNLGPLSNAYLDDFGLKLAQALYFFHLGKRCTGTVLSVRVDPAVSVPGTDALFNLIPQRATTKRGKVDLSERFTYRFQTGQGMLGAVALFQQQMAFVLTAMDETTAAEALSIGIPKDWPQRRCRPT